MTFLRQFLASLWRQSDTVAATDNRFRVLAEELVPKIKPDFRGTQGFAYCGDRIERRLNVENVHFFILYGYLAGPMCWGWSINICPTQWGSSRGPYPKWAFDQLFTSRRNQLLTSRRKAVHAVETALRAIDAEQHKDSPEYHAVTGLVSSPTRSNG